MLLQEDAAGSDDAAANLLPLIYEQLRAIAQQRMSGERSGHTLQATALVHEVYLKLIGDGDAEDRGDGAGVAARDGDERGDEGDRRSSSGGGGTMVCHE